jgi:hypothetical protein
MLAKRQNSPLPEQALGSVQGATQQLLSIPIICNPPSGSEAEFVSAEAAHRTHNDVAQSSHCQLHAYTTRNTVAELNTDTREYFYLRVPSGET